MGFIPLYGSSDKQRILALFSPTDSLTAVALYLLNQWWAVDHILRTADPARDGAVAVRGEFLILICLLHLERSAIPLQQMNQLMTPEAIVQG